MSNELEHFILEMNQEMAKRFHAFFSQLVKFNPKKHKEILFTFDTTKLSACYISNLDNRPIFLTERANTAFFNHYLNKDNFVDGYSDTPYSFIITQSNFNSFFQNMEPLLKMKGPNTYVLRTDNEEDKVTLHFSIKDSSGSEGVDILVREAIPIEKNDNNCFYSVERYNLKVFKPLILQKYIPDDNYIITFKLKDGVLVLLFERHRGEEEVSKRLIVRTLNKEKIKVQNENELLCCAYKVNCENIPWLATVVDKMNKLPGNTITTFSIWETCIVVTYENSQANDITSVVEFVIKGVTRISVD
jgi:hypothetical protein